ncbi:MAG: hypothetical protein ABW166_11775, partial [Sedimenticola sp.]
MEQSKISAIVQQGLLLILAIFLCRPSWSAPENNHQVRQVYARGGVEHPPSDDGICRLQTGAQAQ